MKKDGISTEDKIIEVIKSFGETLTREQLHENEFENVFVDTTPGNHSRSTASKEESVRGENFDLLIPYVLAKEFKEVDNVFIEENTLDKIVPILFYEYS